MTTSSTLAGGDAGTRDELADAGGAELGGLDVLERSAEAPDRRAHTADERDRVVIHHRRNRRSLPLRPAIPTKR